MYTSFFGRAATMHRRLRHSEPERGQKLISFRSGLSSPLRLLPSSTRMLVISYVLAILFTLSAANPLDRRSPALDDCLNAAGLSPISSSSPDYSSIVLPFNLRLQRFPAAVVFPTSIEAVSAAVKCGKRLGVAVVARGGGHSYVSQVTAQG